MPSHKLVVRGTTTLSLHERFTRLGQNTPTSPPAPPVSYRPTHPAPAPPRPQPTAQNTPWPTHAHYITPQQRPRPQPHLEPWTASPAFFHHRPGTRRWATTFSGDSHRNATLRAALLLKRRSMIQQRLGVRRTGPRSSWGRAMRRDRGPATFRRRHAGVFLNRGRARRVQTESAGASRGASRNTAVSKEELDNQLDQYMSRTKHALDQDLVAYRQSGGAS